MHLKSKKGVGFQRKKYGYLNIISNWSIPIFMDLCKPKVLVNILNLSLSLMISVEYFGLISLKGKMKHLTILKNGNFLLRSKVVIT